MGRPLHNPPIAGAAWPTLLARPGHLFLALIITILSALPAAAQSTPAAPTITIQDGSVVIPTNGKGTTLHYLVSNDIVKGLTEDESSNYKITNASDNIEVFDAEEGYFLSKDTAGEGFVAFTHKEYDDISFTIPIIIKNDIVITPKTIYINEPTLLEVTGDIPLNSYIFELESVNGSDPANVTLDIADNTISVLSDVEGKYKLAWAHKNTFYWDAAIFTIAKKPSKEDIIVHEKSITVPTSSDIRMSTLIESGVVSGAGGSDEDWIISSSNPDFYVNNNYNYFRSNNPGTSTITFTNKDFKEVSFSIEVTSKMSPADYVYQNLGTVYLNESKPITIPDDCISLGEFTVTKSVRNDYYTGDFDYVIGGNDLTITGKVEGNGLLRFEHKYGIVSVVITIAKKPSTEDIIVHEKSITVPTSLDFRLSTLIESGVVSGAGGYDSDWIISSSNSDFYVNNDYNYFLCNIPGTSTITYTNKDFKDVSFSIEVTAKLSPTDYIRQNLGTVFIGVQKVITIPDDCYTEDFTVEKSDWGAGQDGDYTLVQEGNQLTFMGTVAGQSTLMCHFNKYGFGSGAWLTIAKKPSKEDINVHEESITIPTSASIYLSKLIESGIVSGVGGSDNDWIITSSNPDFYIYPTEYNSNHFSAYITGTSTITYTHKDFKEVSFSIDVTSKMSPAIYIGRNLGSVYLNESKSITIPDDCISLDDYSEIVKTDYTWTDYPNADFEVKRDGNKLTITGLGEGQRGLRFNHKVYGWITATITIAKKPSADDIKTPGSGVVIPTRTGLNLQNMIRDGWVTGIDANQVNDFTLTSSDNDIFQPYNNSSNGFARGNKTGEATLTFTHKELPDVKFDFVVNVKKGPAESIINHMGNPYVGTPYTITLDSEIPLSDYEFKLLNDKGEEDPDLVLTIDGNNLTILGNAPMECVLWYTYLPTNSRPGHGFSIVEAPANTPVVDEDGNGQSQTSIETPVKITLPAEIAEKAEGKTVIWKSDNEGVATVDENGLVHPVKVGKTVITASVEDVTSRAGATTLMSIEFWVTDVEISVPTTLKVGETAKATYKVVPEDCPNKPDKLWWRPYNTAVVAIDSDGNIKAVGPGSTEVALIVGSGKKFAIITVVGDDEPEVTEINLDTEKISGVEGTTYHLQADVVGLTWSSSDESVAVVDQNGIVTLVGAGRAIITATAPNGVKATCEVVVEAASGINGVEADTEAAFAPVYDLTGRLVARTPEQMATLRAGIYIQAGRKIYISK